jgi:excisionase family DNA binding protein
MNCMEEREEMLLTSREVAEILDLSPDTVNEFARKQALPAVKRGRQWRFRRRDIASFKRHLSKVSDSGLRLQQGRKVAA